MTDPQWFLVRASALLACVAASAAAHAEGLQVAPVSLDIPGKSGIVWLENESNKPLRAQVRVFRWDQDNGEDTLSETDGLVASPPFAEIGPGKRQVIRLVRFGQDAANVKHCEQAYRIIVDEVPDPAATSQRGLTYKLRYSVPVYLTDPECAQANPELRWSIQSGSDRTWLEVANSGQTRAQIARLAYVSEDGNRVSISDGLFGYVLPGATRRFAVSGLASSTATGGRIEATVNGKQIEYPVALASQRP